MTRHIEHHPPQGRRIWLLFYRRFINCLLKHREIWKKGQFKHRKAAPISQNYKITREIAQNARSYSVATKNVARNTISCQKVAEQLVESPNCGFCLSFCVFSEKRFVTIFETKLCSCSIGFRISN